ncbi:MAG TPA: MGMT family protein [bacterium]|nr:MGMT family protein [bacterium]
MIPSIFLFSTDFDSVAIVWKKVSGTVKILEIMITNPKLSAEQRVAVKYFQSSISACEKVTQLSEKIKNYCRGKNEEFNLEMFDFSQIPKFRKRVYLTLFKTKRGETLSYGELASRSGYPGAARAVGTAMKNNPFPFIIPCHRVIKSDGSLGGFFGAEEMKRKLIQLESGKIIY